MGLGGQRHTSSALPSGKTRYPLYRVLYMPQGRSGRLRNISPPTGVRSTDRPARSVVAIPTELSRPTEELNLLLKGLLFSSVENYVTSHRCHFLQKFEHKIFLRYLRDVKLCFIIFKITIFKCKKITKLRFVLAVLVRFLFILRLNKFAVLETSLLTFSVQINNNNYNVQYRTRFLRQLMKCRSQVES
jgi:hypothetical protein